MNEMKNAEGYKDPTAGEAIRRASKSRYRPMVYVCSPYSGDIEGNTERARRYSRYAVDQGMIPIAPHLLLPQYMTEDERDLALFMDIAILSKCAELWVFGDRITEGMEKEISYARSKGMKARYIAEEKLICTK
jgi:dienelactone hydrolase